jgi:homopolymeric O-antigen transport system ATP-binding protein
MKPIIRAQGVSKEYRIGTVRTSYATLRDSLTKAAKLPFRFKDREPPETIWALRDIDFDVHPGEVLGLIGPNGAGKSTLLKILSRVTEPTMGRIELYGRSGSLLEVGTGFHPELSGRENIFLNGTILGMGRREIARNFDEIVAFAEVERFIDTPVKHFSSGMYLRLAFAVAAHLDPEILIVDEVLAVGDARFQRKCLQKMEDVSHLGRTVIFVSHNMAAISRLCSRALLIKAGTLEGDGPTDEIVNSYLRAETKSSASREWSVSKAPGNEVVRVRSVRICTEDTEIAESVDIRRPVGMVMEVEVLRDGHVLAPNFHVYNEEGVAVFVSNDSDPAWVGRPRPSGIYTSTAWIPGNFLAEGMLYVGAAVSTLDPVKVHFFEPQVVAFRVVDNHEPGSVRGEYRGAYPGVVRPALKWTTKYTPASAFVEEEALVR